MNNWVSIGSEKFSQTIIELINGEKGSKDIDPEFIVLARALEQPKELPYFIEEIFDLRDYKYVDDLRFALIRVQIYCDIHMNMDIEYFQMLQYAAKTLENSMFGELLVEGVDFEELEIDRRKRKDKKSKSSKKGKKKK